MAFSLPYMATFDTILMKFKLPVHKQQDQAHNIEVWKLQSIDYNGCLF